jgi:hypothetical protein
MDLVFLPIAVLPLTSAAFKSGLDAVEKGKTIGAKTERERDWLEAIELYYTDYDKVDQTERGLAYEKAMEAPAGQVRRETARSGKR